MEVKSNLGAKHPSWGKKESPQCFHCGADLLFIRRRILGRCGLQETLFRKTVARAGERQSCYLLMLVSQAEWLVSPLSSPGPLPGRRAEWQLLSSLAAETGSGIAQAGVRDLREADSGAELGLHLDVLCTGSSQVDRSHIRIQSGAGAEVLCRAFHRDSPSLVVVNRFCPSSGQTINTSTVCPVGTFLYYWNSHIIADSQNLSSIFELLLSEINIWYLSLILYGSILTRVNFLSFARLCEPVFRRG